MMKEKREEVINECPECGSTEIEKDKSHAEIVCQNCGLVIDDNLIDRGPDWRTYDAEQGDQRIHVGPPATPTRFDNLSTTIGWKNRDSYGKPIPTRNVSQLYRMRKWQRRFRIASGTEKNLVVALTELDRMASSMGLPRDVRETAAMIYRKATSKNLVRGRTIEGMITSVLYAACRQCNVPRTLDEITASSDGILRKEIGRNYRFLIRELSLKIELTSPKKYVRRFCDELKLSSNVSSKAIEILEEANLKGLVSGRSPAGSTAAAIYIASILCKERRTQREIGNVAGVTEVTVRNRFKPIAERLNIKDLNIQSF